MNATRETTPDVTPAPRSSTGSGPLVTAIFALLFAALACVWVYIRMRYLPALLVALGLATAAAGCTTIPQPIADGIAQLDSNTHLLAQDYRRCLTGGGLTDDEIARDKALLPENERLSSGLATWAKNHAEDQ